jgi:serine/threonine protein kinase
MIGQKLNKRYKITARLGKGAFGTVYRATDMKAGVGDSFLKTPLLIVISKVFSRPASKILNPTRHEVALKVIASDLAVDPAMLERFKREGEALQALRHPNIVGFIDAFQHAENYVIVMEYVSGGSLHELIKAGPMMVERTQQIGLDLCDALIRAHRLKIIHRDLKPENVLIADDGTPKLADFGIARISADTRISHSGMQFGTPYYMAPEAWLGKSLDAQADIWSLGVVLFEMLAGQVPFGGDTAPAVMTKVLKGETPDLKKLRDGVPHNLVNIITRMLTLDKDRRYQTMREVAVDLERSQPAAISLPAKAEHISIDEIEREKVEREVIEKAAREKVEQEAAEKARLEFEELAGKKVAKEKADREAADKFAQEEAARLVEEKLSREKQEREVLKKTAQERTAREAAEKRAREKTEQRYARRTEFIGLLSKIVPSTKVFVVVGIIVGVFWFGSWAMPKFPPAVPTAESTTPLVQQVEPPTSPTPSPTLALSMTSTPAIVGEQSFKIEHLETIAVENLSKLTQLAQFTYNGNFLGLSPSGKMMITDAGLVYDLESRQVICDFSERIDRDHGDGFALSDNYAIIDIYRNDDEIKSWNLLECTDKEINIPAILHVGDITIAPNDIDVLFTAGNVDNRHVLINWDLERGEEKKRTALGSSMVDMKIASDGVTFAASTGGGFAQTYTLADFVLISKFAASNAWANIVLYRPEKDVLITSDEYPTSNTNIRVWKISTEKIIYKIPDATKISDSGLGMSSDGKLFTASKEKALSFWDIDADRESYKLELEKLIVGSIFSDNQKILLVLLDGNRVAIYGVNPDS